MFRRQSLKQKTVGTVGLLKQSLFAIAGLTLAGGLVAIWINYAIGAIIAGVGLFAVGGTVIAFRLLIWDAYQDSYSKTQHNSFWRKPSLMSYKINIYLLMPLLMIFGVILVISGVFARL